MAWHHSPGFLVLVSRLEMYSVGDGVGRAMAREDGVAEGRFCVELYEE